MNLRAGGPVHHHGFKLLRAEYRSTAVGRAVVIVVDQHPGPIQVLTGRPNAQNLSILESNLFTQDIFRSPGSLSPNPARIP